MISQKGVSVNAITGAGHGLNGLLAERYIVLDIYPCMVYTERN